MKLRFSTILAVAIVALGVRPLVASATPSIATLERLARESYNYNRWYTAPKRKQTTTKTAPVPIVLSPAEQAARNELERMADALNRAEGVEFTGSITYSVEDHGKIVPKQISASTTLERTSKVLIQTTDSQSQPDGTISSDGRLFTLYDAASGRYATVTVSPDVYSMELALEVGGKQVFPTNTANGLALRMSLGFPMIFLNRIYDVQEVPVDHTLTYSMVNSTSVDGKPVVLVTQTLSSVKTGSIAETYMIDSATNLPLQFTQIETHPGKPPITDIQETFQNLKVIRKAVPAETFTVSLPPTATLVDPPHQQQGDASAVSAE